MKALRCVLLLSSVALLTCVETAVENAVATSQSLGHRSLLQSTMTSDSDLADERLLQGLIEKFKGTWLGRMLAKTWIGKWLQPEVYLAHASNKQAAITNLFPRFNKKSLETSNPFESTKFTTWYNIVNKQFKTNFRDGHMYMLETLKTTFGELKLVTLLAKADLVPKSRPATTNLLETLIDTWLVPTPKTTEDVYQFLKLDESNDLFKDPLFSVWLEFAYKANGEDVDKWYSKVLATLKISAKEALKSNLLRASIEGDSVFIKNLQVEIWKEQGFTSREVHQFMNLKIIETAEDLAKYKLFLLFAQSTSTSFAAFEKNVSILAPETLVQLYSRSTKDDPYCAALEAVIYEDWYRVHATTEELFNLFQYDKFEETVLKNPLLIIVMKFALRNYRRAGSDVDLSAHLAANEAEAVQILTDLMRKRVNDDNKVSDLIRHVQSIVKKEDETGFIYQPEVANR
ncbi:hypothetical protein CCR75_008176 [Bremia lactucae]|uniref:RxLR effector protein n=1 Tax=Bremia lactucae TaxID=4779 RepID=A0A976FMI7_BRELC|nr:hypothetical protein CCR75_008176 [Bremia lactucae]